MATISSAGIGSGLDVNSIVTQLVALERKPIEQLSTQTGKLNTQLSAFGKLQTAFATLRDSARTLSGAEAWNPTLGSSSDASAVSVTTGAGTSPANYSVQVSALAFSQTLVAGTAYASGTSTVGAGTLTLELGAWDAGQTTFTPKSGATAVSVSIAATDTLEAVRDKINGAGAGVTASIVNDASGARLVMRSTDSGTANAFRVSVADNGDTGGNGTTLSALAFDPSAGVTGGMTQRQAAADAVATINGIDVRSSSNTLADVIDGATLTLGKVTTAPVDVAIKRDGETIQKSVSAFVTAYNALVSLVREQTKYDAATKTGGPLQGDRAAINLGNQLRNLIGGTSTASPTFQRLPDVGLDIQTDGTLKLNTAKLNTAIGKITDLKAMFTTTDDVDATREGFGVRLRKLADQLLGAEGALTTRQEGIRSQISRNGTRETELEDRVAQVEKRLKAQYSALDTRMASLNQLSSYVTAQVAKWNASA